MSLDEYRRKRDPKKTPEPFGGAKREHAAADLRRPAARRAAAPLRLPARAERRARVVGGAEGRAARAWRAARSPSTSRITRSSTRRFEGEIPQGQYGAGTVELWDSGTYELLEEKRDGGLTVGCTASGCEGAWTLVPAHLDGKEQNWLLIRKRDDDAERTGAPASYRADARHARPRRSRAASAWLFEVKCDGYRALAYVRGGDCRLVSRNGNDLTDALRGGRAALAQGASKTPNAVLDGEVCGSTSGRAELLAAAAGRRRARLLRLRRPRGSTASRWSTCRSSSASERLSALLDGRNATVASRSPSTTAMRCSRPPRSRASRA